MTKRESKWRGKNERNLNLFFIVLSFKVTTYLLIAMMAHQFCEKSERNKKSESRAYTGKLCWENQSGSFNNCGCTLKAIFIWMHYYAKVKYLFILPKKMKGNKLCFDNNLMKIAKWPSRALCEAFHFQKQRQTKQSNHLNIYTYFKRGLLISSCSSNAESSQLNTIWS